MNSLEQLTRFEETEMQPQGMAWPDLSEEPLPLFPTELLPEKCARLVEAVAASLPVPVDYAVCALLGAASAALVGRVTVQPRQHHREPVQLYLCLGGESGTNKSGPLRLFIAPLEEYLAEKGREIIRRNRDRQAEREVLSNQAKRKNLTPGDRANLRRQMEEMQDEKEMEVILTDTTPESLVRRMKRQGGNGIIHTDEGSFINVLAGVTYGKQGGAANLDTVLKGFDGGRVFVDRVGGEPVDIERANLSITVGMQPSIIHRMTSSADLADRGFPQRVLYFLPDNLVGVDLLNLPAIPRDYMADWSRLLLILAAAHRDHPAMLSLTKGAQAVYNLHRQDMADRALSDMGGSSATRSWARKAHGKTARLAGLLALLEDPDAAIVEESHVRAAVAMMNSYFIPHMKRAFGGSSDLSPDALALVDVLRGRESITQSQLLHDVSGQKKYKGEAGKAHFQEVIRELAQAGYIRLTTPASGGIGRRPGPVLLVNPALHGNHKAAVPLTEGTI
ncbi:MAG: DUF3987 domain-containing protein [Clostridia bacterium]|nr:DUF3987 domain-containing protein [Clostridia bacterium]